MDDDLNERKIVLNSVRCNICNSVVISHYRHHFVTCTCGRVSADGGKDYLKRSWARDSTYTELSVYSDAPFETIRENTYRGSRGKDGQQPLTWVKLSEISNQYLIQLMQYCLTYINDQNLDELYLKEYDYRLANNIHIQE